MLLSVNSFVLGNVSRLIVFKVTLSVLSPHESTTISVPSKQMNYQNG